MNFRLNSPWNHSTIELISTKILDILWKMNIVDQPINNIVYRPIVDYRSSIDEFVGMSNEDVTWIILPLCPKIIKSDLNIHILKLSMSNSISFGFEFFFDKLNLIIRDSIGGKMSKLTSVLSDVSIIPSLSSSICSCIARIASRPNRSLSRSVQRLKTPVHSRRQSN